MKNVLVAAALLVAGGLALTVWYATREASPPSPGAATTTTSRPAESAAPRRAAGDPRAPYTTSRPAGAADVPATAAEAARRPEVRHNKVIADIRSDFAAGRYAAVVHAAQSDLEREPERDEVRAFLVMAACALGDGDVARREHAKLPPARQEFTARRCATSGVSL